MPLERLGGSPDVAAERLRIGHLELTTRSIIMHKTTPTINGSAASSTGQM